MGFIGVVLVLIVDALLIVFLFKKAKPTKKSTPFIITSIVCGAVGVAISMVVTIYLSALVSKMMPWCIVEEVDASGQTVRHWKDVGSMISYNLVNNFLSVALVEEFSKSILCLIGLAIAKKATKTKYFNNTFEAVFYFSLSALSFGVIEDVGYVMGSNLVATISRIITAFAGHLFFGALFGFFYAKAEGIKATNDLSKEISEKNTTTNLYNKKSAYLILVGFIIPVALHGLYDFVFQITPSFEEKYPVVFGVLLGVVALILISYSVFCIILLRKTIKGKKEINQIAEENCRSLYPNIEF